jgi:membrane-associated phospholipid phosphatase
MPSLHVTIATLMALLAWRYNRTAGIAFTVFTVVILIGSIMLGWHYSADGLAGIALALVFWGVAGKIIQMWAADCARVVEEQPMLATPALSET